MRSKRSTKWVNPNHCGCLSLMYLYVTKVEMNSSIDRPAVEVGVILLLADDGDLPPLPPLGVPPILRGSKLGTPAAEATHWRSKVLMRLTNPEPAANRGARSKSSSGITDATCRLDDGGLPRATMHDTEADPRKLNCAACGKLCCHRYVFFAACFVCDWTFTCKRHESSRGREGTSAK